VPARADGSSESAIRYLRKIAGSVARPARMKVITSAIQTIDRYGLAMSSRRQRILRVC
jgi:hypothetical protein